STFPSPNLLRFLFCNILGYPAGPRYDKMHWSVVFNYQDTPCAIGDEKFGLRFYRPVDKRVDEQEIFGRLNAALGIVEKYVLSPAAAAALEHNDIAIVNHFSSLNARYLFFRKLAEERMRKVPPRSAFDQHEIAVAQFFKTEV